MPDQPVIIVDDTGREHIFPPGMDPKRAAQAVRNTLLQEANKRPLKEPTTFRGGFLKSLAGPPIGSPEFKKELGDMLGSAAHPQTAGDFLSLIVPDAKGLGTMEGGRFPKSDAFTPSGEPVGNIGLRGLAKAGAEVLDATPKIISSPLEDKVVGALRNAGKKPPPRWLDSTKPNRGGTPDAGLPQEPMPHSQGAFNEMPLHEQMAQMGETPAPERGRSEPPIKRLGSETANPDAPPRLAGKAPTLEEALQQAVEEARQAGDTEFRSMAPDIQTAGEGPLHQSGTFGKSGSAGQPGGYSSGRPSLTDAQYEDLLKRAGGRGPIDGVSGDAPPPHSEGPPAASEPSVDLETYLNHLVEHDPGAMAGRAQDLRSRVGSRDAARELFGSGNPTTQGWIKQMAPGPSRLPSEAQQRIEDAILKALEGEQK